MRVAGPHPMISTHHVKILVDSQDLPQGLKTVLMGSGSEAQAHHFEAPGWI